MAKGTGLIGNFKGKVGNMVGYNLKDSNNKQTQGIRVYQPVVRNPKSYAQAQQRARMLPINNMYRLLKDIIDRGQEGVAYGNKSRLAWMKKVMKDFNGPWQDKGSTEVWPIACPLTQGSLPKFVPSGFSNIGFILGVNESLTQQVTDIQSLFDALKVLYPSLMEGDQVTIVVGVASDGKCEVVEKSYIMSSTDSTAVTGFSVDTEELIFAPSEITGEINFGTVIISREGSNGAHLRSTQSVLLDNALADEDVYKSAAAKTAAIASYMAAGANTDWPQEALEG